MPTALLNVLAPFSFALPPPVHFHVCRDRREAASCTDCPVGSYNTGLQWRPVRRLTFDFYLFPAESIDPGPWFSVKFVS